MAELVITNTQQRPCFRLRPEVCDSPSKSTQNHELYHDVFFEGANCKHGVIFVVSLF
jgi:hypothetical protein